MALPGVVRATVDVKSGAVEVISEDKRTGEKAIRETIRKTNFNVVSVKGPFSVTR